MSRLSWAAGHLTAVFGGSALIMLLAGLGLAVGYGGRPGAVLAACLVQLPAGWVIGGVAVLLYGAAPRLAPAAWGVAAAVLLVGWAGPALNVPRAVLDVSPFGHLPKLPGGRLSGPPLLTLLALATISTACGLAALRRRDLTA